MLTLFRIYASSVSLFSHLSFYCFWREITVIKAEVTAQADDVILNSGKSELFVQTRLTEKYVPDCFIMLSCFIMSPELTTENIVSVSGLFTKWSSRKTIRKKNSVAETPARVFLFASGRAHSVRNELNLAQHANLDTCYTGYPCQQKCK